MIGARHRKVITALLLGLRLTVSTSTLAESKNALEEEGWVVAARGTVSDDFEGCDYDRPVPLDEGFIFVCSEYSYHYAYRPDFYVMRQGASTKYLIDDEEFQGTLRRGTATKTYVVGEFEGCDFGRTIVFENGLGFECETYHYHYAFHPKAMIIQYEGSLHVTIAGEAYSGIVVRLR